MMGTGVTLHLGRSPVNLKVRTGGSTFVPVLSSNFEEAPYPPPPQTRVGPGFIPPCRIFAPARPTQHVDENSCAAGPRRWLGDGKHGLNTRSWVRCCPCSTLPRRLLFSRSPGARAGGHEYP